MQTRLKDGVRYTLELNGVSTDMNARIGNTIKLSFDGTINCISCGKVTKKSFAQGFCYPCVRSAPNAQRRIYGTGRGSDGDVIRAAVYTM